MWLKLGNVYTEVRNASLAEQNWLSSFLTIQPVNPLSAEPALGLLRNLRFLTGLVPLVERKAREAGYQVQRIDSRVRPYTADWQSLIDQTDLGWLEGRKLADGSSYQLEAVKAAVRAGRGIIRAGVGCHRKGQLILMADGSTKAVEDVAVGDLLVGPEGFRRVLKLHRGQQQMAEIRPIKGEPWVVNLDHVLTVVETGCANFTDVRLSEFINWSETARASKRLFRTRGGEVKFSVEVLDSVEDYYGFELDGDGRYLLGDFTVTHNSGKGMIAVGIAKAVPIKWLFAVHRTNLIDDIAERWIKHGDGTAPVKLGESGWQLGERLSLCMLQTLYTAVQRPDCRAALAGVQGIIADECHVLGASSYGAGLEALPNAYARIGLSGSPIDRTDGKSLLAIAQLGPIVYNVTTKELIKCGHVSKANVTMTRVNHESNVRGPWPTVKKKMIVESRARNAALLRDAITCPKPAILFIDNIAHGRALKKDLLNMGISCEFAFGEVPKSKRKKLVERLNFGELDVVIANEVFVEGVDAPNLASVIIGGGGKSVIKSVQSAGRGARITKNKTEFELYDYLDQGNFWLEEHSLRRVETYKKQGYDIKFK